MGAVHPTAQPGHSKLSGAQDRQHGPLHPHHPHHHPHLHPPHVCSVPLTTTETLSHCYWLPGMGTKHTALLSALLYPGYDLLWKLVVFTEKEFEENWKVWTTTVLQKTEVVSKYITWVRKKKTLELYYRFQLWFLPSVCLSWQGLAAIRHSSLKRPENWECHMKVTSAMDGKLHLPELLTAWKEVIKWYFKRRNEFPPAPGSCKQRSASSCINNLTVTRFGN